MFLYRVLSQTSKMISFLFDHSKNWTVNVTLLTLQVPRLFWKVSCTTLDFLRYFDYHITSSHYITCHFIRCRFQQLRITTSRFYPIKRPLCSHSWNGSSSTTALTVLLWIVQVSTNRYLPKHLLHMLPLLHILFFS